MHHQDLNKGKSLHKVLEVGIIGAGIAGLSAAIALRRAGHHVHVFERSRLEEEVGAAVTVTPNGGRILSRWSFDQHRAAGSDRSLARTIDARTLQCLEEHDCTGAQSFSGLLPQAYQRANMHAELRRLAQRPDSEGWPVSISLGAPVACIDCQESTIHFERKNAVRKDLIICAGGVKSPSLIDANGLPMPARSVGRAVYRLLVPMNSIRSDKIIWQTFEKFGWSSLETPYHYNSVRCDIYPCRASGIISIAVYHVASIHGRPDDWNSPATISEVLDVLKGMHPFFSNLVKHANRVQLHTVRVREPVSRMVRCSTVLIGDAAHVMQTMHAQGACMGIEDAAALEVLFRDFGPCDSVELRLRLYDQLRLPRISVAVLFSNAMYHCSPLPYSTWATAARKYYKGHLPESIAPWTLDVQDFLWKYDVFAEAEKALLYKKCLFGMPSGIIKHFNLVFLPPF